MVGGADQSRRVSARVEDLHKYAPVTSRDSLHAVHAG